jgi:hypothetical protein
MNDPFNIMDPRPRWVLSDSATEHLLEDYQTDIVRGPLERQQKVILHPKHVMQENGLFKWERMADIECYCGHLKKIHLDGIDVCLSTKPEICICERFMIDKKIEVEISPKQIARKNLPEKYSAHFNVGPPTSITSLI